jgi:general secretion pathway protein N
MIDRLALLLLVGACLLFGAILIMELAPAGAEDEVVAQAARARSDAASPTARRQNPRPEELVATALARPLFNSARRPPQDAPSGAAADDLADARLTGIVTTPGRRIAIFAVSGDKPLKVADGDAVSGWRIESITPREVSLNGPSGTKTLQPKLDPNLAPPPSQPPVGQPGGRAPTPPAAGRPRMPMPGVAPAAARPPSGAPAVPPGTLPRAARLRQQR